MSEGRFRRAYLGIGLGNRPLPPRLARELRRVGCVEVVEVVEDVPAASAGVRPGDLILALDGEPVTDVASLQRLMASELIGSRVNVTVARDERLLELPLVPDELAG
jgi:S1-C subfamily serine protease